jgi:hypothetical protein
MALFGRGKARTPALARNPNFSVAARMQGDGWIFKIFWSCPLVRSFDEALVMVANVYHAAGKLMAAGGQVGWRG